MVKFKYNFLGSVPKICQLIQLYNFIDLLQPKKKKKNDIIHSNDNQIQPFGLLVNTTA